MTFLFRPPYSFEDLRSGKAICVLMSAKEVVFVHHDLEIGSLVLGILVLSQHEGKKILTYLLINFANR